MKKLALTGGVLIDGNGGAPIPNSLVLVQDKTILYTGPDHGDHAGYEVVDVQGKYLIPGLIDTHIHLSVVT